MTLWPVRWPTLIYVISGGYFALKRRLISSQLCRLMNRAVRQSVEKRHKTLGSDGATWLRCRNNDGPLGTVLVLTALFQQINSLKAGQKCKPIRIFYVATEVKKLSTSGKTESQWKRYLLRKKSDCLDRIISPYSNTEVKTTYRFKRVLALSICCCFQRPGPKYPDSRL